MPRDPRSALPSAAAASTAGLALATALLVACGTALPPVGGEATRLERGRCALDACRGDWHRHCGHLQPGGDELAACLARHAADLVPRCAGALVDAGFLRESRRARIGGAPPACPADARTK